jgi:hypothetical protein
LVAKALNGNCKPDWNDMNDIRYYPYFKFSSSLHFSHAHFDCGDTAANVGSHLCFKNKQIAEYAGKTFIEQYEKLMKF